MFHPFHLPFALDPCPSPKPCLTSRSPVALFITPAGKELGSRRSKQQVEFLGDGSASESASSRGERFRSIKAREAAAKAAVKAVGEGSNGTSNGAAAEAASAAASTVMTMQQEEEEVSVPDAPPAKDGFAAAVNGSAGKAAAKKKKASKKK